MEGLPAMMDQLREHFYIWRHSWLPYRAHLYLGSKPDGTPVFSQAFWKRGWRWSPQPTAKQSSSKDAPSPFTNELQANSTHFMRDVVEREER